jgi:hypothetical protein
VTRLVAPVLTLALALGTGALAARAAVPGVGDPIVRRLAQLAAALTVPAKAGEVEAPPPVPPRPDPTPATAPRPRWNVRAATAPAARPSTESTLEIPADRLARLTERQLRSLGAVDVIDANGNAAGASLSGVGALGVGLDDGDVVTSIDGRATRDVSTALAAAVQAYGAGHDTARATVRRNGYTLPVVVHIPPRSASGPKG